MGRDKIHICPKCGKDYFYHGSYINHKNNCQWIYIVYYIIFIWFPI